MRYVAYVSSDIEELIPDFLRNRRAELELLRSSLAQEDADTLEHLGERMYAVGNPYGFPDITTFGRHIREASAKGALASIEPVLARYEDYLANVEVVVVEALPVRRWKDQPSPRVQHRSARSPRRASQAAPKRRVLIVEDHFDTVHSLVLLFRKGGHQVEYATNGRVALDIASTFRPDVVFLDIGLPGLDGFAVCRHLKGKLGLKSTRVIAVTGYGTENDRIRSKDAGCELHLVKPVDPNHLMNLV